MAAGEEKNDDDFYSVLGLKKECTALDLKNAYKKLALKWHPDRCSASGNSKFVEEAKKKFQAIQEAYSVLSDTNKRFLYDVGVYNNCDDDENGMGDFLGEMAIMMNQTKPSENGPESFEDLKDLFEEMFQRDMDSFFGSNPQTVSSSSSSCSYSCSSNNNLHSNNNINKRDFSDMSSGEMNLNDFSRFDHLCSGGEGLEDLVEKREGREAGKRRGRKQKVSSSHDVSSLDSRISAG